MSRQWVFHDVTLIDSFPRKALNYAIEQTKIMVAC